MAKTDPQVNFRLPVDLRTRLMEAADEGKRTLTAEIVARLEASFDTREIEMLRKRLDRISDREKERSAANFQLRQRIEELEAQLKATGLVLAPDALDVAIENRMHRVMEKVLVDYFGPNQPRLPLDDPSDEN